jgi:hypothetical protein
MKLRPVMNNQGVGIATVRNSLASMVQQGLGELRERNPVIAVKSPSCLGTSKSLGRARYGPTPSGDRLGHRKLFLHKLLVTPLQTRLQQGWC